MGLIDRIQKLSEDKKTAKFKGDLRRGSDEHWHTDFLPTGIPAVDFALGGGFGYGRLSELYGNWSSGKTMLLYYALARNQQQGGVSMLVETEGAFDAGFFQALGGNPNELFIPEEKDIDTVQKVFNFFTHICDAKIREEKETGEQVPLAVGWDSIAATASEHLMDTGMDKIDLSKPIAMSQGTQLISLAVRRCRTAIIACNQVRESISRDANVYVEKNTPGGKSWPFHCSQRINLTFDGTLNSSIIWENPSGRTLEDRGAELGRRIHGKVTKNKLSSPNGQFILPIYTLNNRPHPVYDARTKLGIDLDEALFDFYAEGDFRMPDDERVVQNPTQGYYKIHDHLSHNPRKFRRSQWLEVLNESPHLRTLVYDFGRTHSRSNPATPAEAPNDQS